jgi:hypothetical protein
MATWYINPSTGNDTTGDGSQGNPWRTVKGTLAKAGVLSGDTIHLAEGIYRENDVFTAKTGITWISDGAVRWYGTRSASWSWVNHSGNAWKILNFNATHGFIPLHVVEEDFNHWRPVYNRDANASNPCLCYHDVPLKSHNGASIDTSRTVNPSVSPIDVTIRYKGTHYYDSVNDVLYYHSYQDEDPSTLTIGIGGDKDGQWRLSPGDQFNPVGTPGYTLIAWAPAMRVNGGSGTLIRQTHFLQTSGVLAQSNAVYTWEDSSVDSMVGLTRVYEIGVTSITRSGSTATVTMASADTAYAHGSYKYISGADQAEYNGYHKVTRISSTQFSFPVSGTPPTATGTIVTTHDEHQAYFGGLSSSPDSTSGVATGSGSIRRRIHVTRGYNLGSFVTDGVLNEDWVGWNHPNHGISGIQGVTCRRMFVGNGQDACFPSAANTTPYTLEYLILTDSNAGGAGAGVRSGSQLGCVMTSWASQTTDHTLSSSDRNVFAGSWNGTTDNRSGVNYTAVTYNGTAYTAVGDGSAVETAHGFEGNSIKLPTSAWGDGSLFQGFRYARLRPYYPDLIPSPGSVLVGKKAGFWQRFNVSRPLKPYPNGYDLQMGRPLAGW